jgi:hypothetical protein
MREVSIFEKIFVYTLIGLFFIIFFLMGTSPFHPTTATCEKGVVIDKRFTGEANNLPTLFIDVQDRIIDHQTDNETFYDVEIGDGVNYCDHMDAYIPFIRIYSSVERIER